MGSPPPSRKSAEYIRPIPSLHFRHRPWCVGSQFARIGTCILGWSLRFSSWLNPRRFPACYLTAVPPLTSLHSNFGRISWLSTMMYRFGGNSRVAVVTDRAGPCTATMSSDTSDGGAPLYSPAEPPKEAQSWSSMRLAAVQAREHHRSGAAEITVSRLAEVPAPTLGQDQKVTKLETRTDPSDLGTLNTASNPSPPQIAATKDNCQVSISLIR